MNRWARRSLGLVLGFHLAVSQFLLAQARADCALVYFVESGAGRAWRVYDPQAGSDTLFLSLSGPPSFVEWDTTRTRVEYQVGRDVFQAKWQLGSSPRLVARLPARDGICDVWFNPDSGRWQFYTSEPVGPWTASSREALRRYVELWQSSPGGFEWRRVQADTVTVTRGMCGRPLGDFDDDFLYVSPHTRRMPQVRSRDLAHAIAPGDSGTLEETTKCVDTNDVYRADVPIQTVANRRLEFGWLAPRAPEEDCATFPIVYVDREHDARRTLCAGDPCENQCVALSEACGFLLLSCDWDTTRLIDLESGSDVRSFAAETGVGWAPPLTRATPR